MGYCPEKMYDRPMLIAIEGIVSDITDRKQDEMRKKQLVDEIKHFAYIVSHDLRAPLINVQGFANELKHSMGEIGALTENISPSLSEGDRRKMESLLSEDTGEPITFIESSVGRMNGLIEAILKLSRFERTELEMEPVDMNEPVSEVLTTMAHEIDEHDVSVSL